MPRQQPQPSSETPRRPVRVSSTMPHADAPDPQRDRDEQHTPAQDHKHGAQTEDFSAKPFGRCGLLPPPEDDYAPDR